MAPNKWNILPHLTKMQAFKDRKCYLLGIILRKHFRHSTWSWVAEPQELCRMDEEYALSRLDKIFHNSSNSS